MAGYYFEVLEAVEEPEAIYAGRAGECIAVREIEKDKYIVVIYRELGKEDGADMRLRFTSPIRQPLEDN